MTGATGTTGRMKILDYLLGRETPSLAISASPVPVGAITVVIVVRRCPLCTNANKGLPWCRPTKSRPIWFGCVSAGRRK